MSMPEETDGNGSGAKPEDEGARNDSAAGDPDKGGDKGTNKVEEYRQAGKAGAQETPEKGEDEKAKRIEEAKKKAAARKAAAKGEEGEKKGEQGEKAEKTEKADEDGGGDDEKAKKIAAAKKKAAAKKAAAKKEQPWPYPPKFKDPSRTEDLDKLKDRFADKIVGVGDMSGKPVAYVAPEAAGAVLRFVHEELEFDHLPFVSGADYPEEDVLEVHWQLYSYPRRGRGGKDLALKVHVPRDDARVPSVVDLWTGAEWHEREAFDLLGIRFDGHRNLRRIFMPDGWRGHPLRKDYDRKEQYIGLSETGEDVVFDTPGPYRW